MNRHPPSRTAWRIKATLRGALGLALGSWVTQATSAPQTFLVVNEAGQAVKDAIVSVTVKGTKPTTTTATADMAQRDKAFAPTLLAIQTGTSVSFPNFDTVRHHVYSFSPTKPFELRLYAGTPAAPIVFDKPGTATLGCNIHDRMLAYIHVVSTPYFGMADAAGKVTLDIPPGEHAVQVWTIKMGEKQPPYDTTVKTGGTVTLKVKD